MHADLPVSSCIALAAALAALTAAAQPALPGGSANAVIQNRRDANATALQRRMEDEAQGIVRQPGEEKPPSPTLTLGLGYENGGGGARSLSVPFALDFAPGHWYLVVGGGATSARSDAGHDRGWNDVSVAASYTFTSAADPRWQLTPTFSVLIPVGGAVGSGHGIQTVELSVSFKSPTAPWKIYLDGSLAHADASADGVSRYARGATLKGEYIRSEVESASLKVERSLTGGQRGSTSSAFEYAFPIPSRPALGGIVILSRVWTRGQRSTGLELDLNYAF